MIADISHIIKQKRESKGMSQRELAEAVGVSVGMIAQIERGTKTLSLGLAAEMSRVFGCTIADITGMK